MYLLFNRNIKLFGYGSHKKFQFLTNCAQHTVVACSGENIWGKGRWYGLVGVTEIRETVEHTTCDEPQTPDAIPAKDSDQYKTWEEAVPCCCCWYRFTSVSFVWIEQISTCLCNMLFNTQVNFCFSLLHGIGDYFASTERRVLHANLDDKYVMIKSSWFVTKEVYPQPSIANIGPYCQLDS